MPQSLALARFRSIASFYQCGVDLHIAIQSKRLCLGVKHILIFADEIVLFGHQPNVFVDC